MYNYPLYFYNTTVCFIDDNERFLKNNILGLDPKYQYRQYVEPEIALKELAPKSVPILNENLLINALSDSEGLDDTINQFAIAVNIKPILELCNNPKRHDNPSVLVVDYAMPSMNGLELCEQLAATPIKKIMITGQADHRIAVEAFNQGIIDYFILKDEIDFYAQLNSAIDKLHLAYFRDISNTLFTNLSKYENFCLSSSKVQSWITAYIKENNINEGYLIDSSGSFLFVTASGDKKFFIIKNKNEMQELLQLAKTQNADTRLTEKLKDRQNMLVFLNDSDYFIPPHHWQPFLHPCTPISEDQSYYVSLIDN